MGTRIGSDALVALYTDPCYGIRQVYPNAERPLPEGATIDLDVVIVHGLNGNPQKTFTHPETFVNWPQDILNRKVPTARVLTFGYRSTPKTISEGHIILDIALQLVANLKDYRRHEAEKNRDLVFVCHSLGGIVVKKVLLLHHSLEDGKAIRSSIVGIIFMATPHCGSELANIGSICANIASTVTEMPKALLKSLIKNSSTLYEISREFVVVAADMNLKLISFYELNPCTPPWWKGKSVLVVDKRSAILGLPNEEIIGAHANHREICRFKGPEDPIFRSVWTRIDDFAREAARRRELPRKTADCENPSSEQLVQEITSDVEGIEVSSTITGSHGHSVKKKHWRVPFFPCSYFTGRKLVLQRISDHFAAHVNEYQRRFAIYGLGGVGKTQLALTFAFQERSKYSGVFFFDADSETTLHEDFGRLHDDLDLGCPKDKVGAVKRWLDLEDNVNCLLLFDNADNLESYQLTDYFPLSNETHIVLTSRDPSAAELTSDGLLLEMMEPEESKALLISRAGLIDPKEKDLQDVVSIVEGLSHLPLAIDQAGTYIRARQCSPAAYMRLFESQRERILKFSPKLSSYNKSVITTWEVSFQRLEADLALAAKLLLIFCFLDSKRISEELLNGVTKPVLKMDEDGNENETSAEDNGVDANLVDLMMEPNEFDTTIERMVALSLVREHTETSGEKDVRIFSLHPLVAYCGRTRAKQWQKREAAEQAICLLSHAFPEWSRDFSIAEFGRLTRSHLDCCFHYPDKPLEFGSDLSQVAKKLLLILYSHKTAQMLALKIVATEADSRLIARAEHLAKKYADSYLDAMCLYVKIRQFMQLKPDEPEETEKMIEDWFQRFDQSSATDVDRHKGKCNSALGDLRNLRAMIRWRLHRGDAPDMLLHDWSPIDPLHPSTLERNAKWFIERCVGWFLSEKERYEDAERLLLRHVSEFAPVDMEGTDEHLAGADRLARLYYVKRDWPKAKAALLPGVEVARRTEREISSWHVLHANVFLQEILVAAGDYDAARKSIGELMPALKELASPDLTASPIFAGHCLMAEIAHMAEDWAEATEQWRLALILGRSVGWPDAVRLALPLCSLEAIEYERGRKRWGDKDLAKWRQRLFAQRVEAGEDQNFLDGFGEFWKGVLVQRVENKMLQGTGN